MIIFVNIMCCCWINMNFCQVLNVQNTKLERKFETESLYIAASVSTYSHSSMHSGDICYPPYVPKNLWSYTLY